MYRTIVFAGTTEGYEICRFLSENGIPVLGCTATEYGTKSLKENEYLKLQGKRLTEEEMKALFLREKPELVLDATHPYASEVTENIRNACKETGCDYIRVLRSGSGRQEAVYVRDTEAAVGISERYGRRRASDDRQQGTCLLYRTPRLQRETVCESAVSSFRDRRMPGDGIRRPPSDRGPGTVFSGVQRSPSPAVRLQISGNPKTQAKPGVLKRRSRRRSPAGLSR